MAKKRKHASGHSVAKEFPSQASPMDVVNHPVRNLPDPTGGMFNPTQAAMPGAPMGESAE